MRTPEFKLDQMKWDEFKKFHNNLEHNLFVKFDDGSFMIRNNYLKPDKRKTYHEYGFRIVRSNDPVCRGVRFFTPDGERVWARSLGNCELLWDIDTNKAYSLDAMWTPSTYNTTTQAQESSIGPNKTDLLPSYIRNWHHKPRFFMYGDGRVVSMPIDYMVPKEYNSEQQNYIKTMTDTCKAWHTMVETKEPRWRFSEQYLDKLNWKPFADMNEKERRGIAIYGFSKHMEPRKVSHLLLEKKRT